MHCKFTLHWARQQTCVEGPVWPGCVTFLCTILGNFSKMIFCCLVQCKARSRMQLEAKHPIKGGCTMQMGCRTSGLGHLTEGREGSSWLWKQRESWEQLPQPQLRSRTPSPLLWPCDRPQDCYTEATGRIGKEWRRLYEAGRAGGRVASRAVNVTEDFTSPFSQHWVMRTRLGWCHQPS